MGAIYVDGVCYSAGGGGGGASSANQVSLDDTNLAYEADNVQEAFEKVTKSLTYEEYQELTEEEKNNGTLYFITDANGDGQSFQPIIYSEEEREIGVWTDGKPLYEKVFTINQTSIGSAWTNTAIDTTDIDSIVNAFGIASDGTFYSGLDGDPTASSHTVLKMRSYATAYIVKLILQYTKISGTAGSGTWTPQGVPAHHYSTDEQVVGTWIDGSTLYEKTFYSDTTISYDSASAVTLNDTIPSNIEVVDIQAYFRGNNTGGNQVYQSDGGRWFHYYYESTENKIYAAQIFTSAGVTNCKTYFTLRYTKPST